MGPYGETVSKHPGNLNDPMMTHNLLIDQT